MDRTIAPPIAQIDRIELPKVNQTKLASGVSVYYTIDTTTDAFKIEALTQGGFLQSKNAAVSVLISKLLLEGTEQYPSGKMMETVDNMGSFLEVTPSFDYSTITLFGLSRFFENNISLFSDVVYDATLLQEDLDKLKTREQERLKLSQEKGSYLASVNLRKILYGNHPYGHHLNHLDLEALSKDEIQRFYSNKIQQFDLFVAGNLPEDFLDQLDKVFTKHCKPLSPGTITQVEKQSSDQIIRDDKFIQSSIRLGKVLFNRTHEDYLDFLVLNEVLGGYFGSRLMKNIREDKGYTYGISSHLYALKESGYFTIGTDVNNDTEADTLHQIQKEIEILQTKLIPEDELDTVKNYLLGSFTNSLSTPFASIDKFKVLNNQGYNLDFYKAYIQSIRAISRDRILELARKHLVWESFRHSIVG